MKSIYARFVLWLIRPALELREAGRPANVIPPASDLGRQIADAVRKVIMEERRPGGLL